MIRRPDFAALTAGAGDTVLRIGLFGVLAVALGLRLIGLRYGLPYVYNPDEVSIMSRALAFAKGDLNPHNFLYPSLYFYVLFAWEGLTALLAVATRAVSFIALVSITLMDGPLPAFRASRNFPSGETAALNGSESSAT